jgi:hypothetical protein
MHLDILLVAVCLSKSELEHTVLHLGNELLVEHSPGLLVERAVDGNNITLCKHLLQAVHSPAANLLLNISLQRLVVKVQQLLAVESLKSSEDSLTDTSDSDGTDDLALEIILVLGDLSNVPLTLTDHLVGGLEVADKGENGHHDVLGDGDDVGSSDLGDGDAAVGLVGSVKVYVVGTDTCCDCDLELLGLCKTLGGEVTRVEAGKDVVSLASTSGDT